MSIVKHHPHNVPELNTSSLPDLIFSVLFFFMIVTHMRTELLMVRYQVPKGTELKKLTHKTTVTNIYIGKQAGTHAAGEVSADGDWQVQINDRLVSPDGLVDCLREVASHAGAEDKQNLSATISADQSAPMGLVGDVKTALRQAGILKVSYIGISQPRHQSRRPH